METQTITTDQARAEVLAQLLEQERTRNERLLIALGRIQSLTPNNAEVQAVIDEASEAQPLSKELRAWRNLLAHSTKTDGESIRDLLLTLVNHNVSNDLGRILYEFLNKDADTLRVLATASAESLRPVWDTPEEDKAWQYLQPATS